jgi:hypothetical protein
VDAPGAGRRGVRFIQGERPRGRPLPRLKVVQRGGRPPRPAPGLVDRAPARGGEQPGPPVRLVPAEARQPAHHLQPGLRRDVLGGIGSDHPQVPQQGRVGITPQQGEGRFTARLGDRQHGRKLIANHRAEYRHACPFSQQIVRFGQQRNATARCGPPDRIAVATVSRRSRHLHRYRVHAGGRGGASIATASAASRLGRRRPRRGVWCTVTPARVGGSGPGSPAAGRPVVIVAVPVMAARSWSARAATEAALAGRAAGSLAVSSATRSATPPGIAAGSGGITRSAWASAISSGSAGERRCPG